MPTSTVYQQATPLRRAKYVTVEELVLSQYEIDRKRLNDELAKLRVPHEESTNVTEGDAKNETKSHPNAWETPTQKDLHAGSLRSPLQAKQHQSRLQPPRDGFNLCLLVGKFEVVVDKYRVDGSRILVAEVEVGDDTGSISLRARDEQIDLLREVSKKQGAVVLRNSTVELYQGKHLRLGVSKWGKMSVYPDGIKSTPNPPSRINQDLNFSLVNLNLVATTKAKVPADPPIPVATVHHKQQKQRQNSFDDSSSRASWNRGRAQGVAQHHQKKIEFQPNQHRYGSTLNASVATYSPMHQQVGGAPSSQSLHVPQIYQQYSDTGSLYSYPPQHHDQRRQFLPDPQYSSQQHFIYQQFHDLQQRHAHQMILLQQQQESQFRDLAQTSLISDSRTESFESGADYPVPTTIGGMLPNSSQYNTGVYSRPPSMQSYLPAPHPSPPHRQLAMNNFEYQYDSLGLSPERNDYRGDEQQLQGNTGSAPTTYASVISPPMSPTQSSRPAPQAPPRQYPDGKHA